VSQEEISFLPYEEAVKLVAAIQEEEDIEQPDRRILTVYNQADKEVCWFDFDEVMKEVAASFDAKPKTGEDDDQKARVTLYIMNRIPSWASDI